VSWKFVDGQQVTKDTVGHVIPGMLGNCRSNSSVKLRLFEIAHGSRYR